MKRNKIVGLCTITSVLILGSNALATPNEWHNMPISGNDSGDIFQLRFEIKSDETTNYTLTIQPGEQFSIIDGNATMTKSIPKRLEVSMVSENSIPPVAEGMNCPS